MVYGFDDDIVRFQNNNKTAISLDDLNEISGVYSRKSLKSTSLLIHDIATKNIKVESLLLREYCNKKGIKESKLKKISDQWIEYLHQHKDDLSLSKSLNKRDKKSENGFLEFTLKNNRKESDNPMSKQKPQEYPQIKIDDYKNIKLVYKAFLKSDKAGFEALQSIKKCKGIAYKLAERSIAGATLRKICKLGMDFTTSSCNELSHLIFLRPEIIRESIVLVNVSNQDLWKGRSDLNRTGDAYEPITYSELRYARKNALPVYYSNNPDAIHELS
ncbi:hypothetical protein EJP617_06830 [Erwinia sp. Ejp617]|nr:hypothetical protein EJP617_06830 [Erwinia sp. Ejp617]